MATTPSRTVPIMSRMDSYSDPDHSFQTKKRADDMRAASTKPRNLGRLSILERLLVRFSPAERLLLYILAALLAASALVMVVYADRSVSVSIPAHGGSFTEGEVGPARFINPLLTLSQPDEDLTALVYSGLMRAAARRHHRPGPRVLVHHLARRHAYTPSRSARTRNSRTARRSPRPTSLFTVSERRIPIIKSPQEANWTGVAVSSPDAHTVVFTLPHAYAPVHREHDARHIAEAPLAERLRRGIPVRSPQHASGRQRPVQGRGRLDRFDRLGDAL